MIGQWINVYFAGNLPFIITAQITDIIKDMIEMTDVKNGSVYYIDFKYNYKLLIVILSHQSILSKYHFTVIFIPSSKLY